MHYPCYFKMGIYTEKTSEGRCALWTVISTFLTQLPRVWLFLFPTMERVCHLTNKIYREILCITKHERMTYITMGGLGLHWHHHQVSAFSPHYRIVLSWDLLAWLSVVKDRILCSFTNFITTPELSGPLHISPDIYHTQITEYSLQTIYQRNHQ